MRVLVLHSDIAPDAPPEEQDTLIAAAAVVQALGQRGHVAAGAAFRAETLDRVLAAHAPELVFNLVEGVDGLGRLAPRAPAMLADRGVRFTGVGAGPMDLTNDKPRTKQSEKAPVQTIKARPTWHLVISGGGRMNNILHERKKITEKDRFDENCKQSRADKVERRNDNRANNQNKNARSTKRVSKDARQLAVKTLTTWLLYFNLKRNALAPASPTILQSSAPGGWS